MHFIDETDLVVASGSGGDGAMSFRRERYVPYGGPDGGDGGRGGNVVLLATTQQNTLFELRNRPIWRADDGRRGGGRRKTGRSAEDLTIRVPVGTRVFDQATGDLLVDLTEDGQTWVAAKGGDGGFGNARFKTSTNRAPRKTVPGWPGEERRLHLELLLMADVGLLGFPNAGKSTFIRTVSSARPRVADYPFTTLVPNLGVVERGLDRPFVIADIPGLIEGSAEGAGLGHRFLRHLARTRVLLHLVSLAPRETVPPADRYRVLRNELARYSDELAHRPELVVLSQCDLVDETEVAEARDALADIGVTALPMSAATRDGIDAIVHLLAARVEQERAAEPTAERPPAHGQPTAPGEPPRDGHVHGADET